MINDYVKDYMHRMKTLRNSDKIFNTVMYSGVGFALGVILCLHKDKEFVQIIAGTVCFFLLVSMMSYKYLTRKEDE
jgi:hypothetical protein